MNEPPPSPDPENGPASEEQPETIAHPAGHSTDVAEGAFIPLEIDGRELAVCRVDGVLYAVSLRCTHAAWSMRNGPLLGCELACDLHGARFDVRDGHPTGGPARRPLDTWPVRESEGRIEVMLPARPASRSVLAGRDDDA